VEIGLKLKLYRTAKRMSLRDLAAKAHCSAGMLSEIELNHVSPSLRTMSKICAGLGVSLSDFLNADPAFDPPIVISQERKECKVAMTWNGARMLHLISNDSSASFSAVVLQIKAGTSVPMRKAANSVAKLGVVLRGRVGADINGDCYQLEEREAVYFNLGVPHRFLNLGEDDAEILFTGSHGFALFEQVEEDIRWHLWTKREHRRKKISSTIEIRPGWGNWHSYC
jgi:transcriptional regulator with XRE-family HTH domain